MGFSLLYKLQGHESYINRISWSPNGQLLASASNDKTARLWGINNGELLLCINNYDDPVGITWSPDGKTIALGLKGGNILFHDISMGKIYRTFKQPSGLLYDLKWSPRSQIIAAAYGDNTIRLWNVETEELIGILKGHHDTVFGLEWSPDGDKLASVSGDHTIILWDPKEGKLLEELNGHSDRVQGISWSPDGKILASASNDKTIRIWYLQEGRKIVLEGHTDSVENISFSFDGQLLASKSYDGTVRVWRCDTWETIGVLDEISSVFFIWCLAFHPNKHILATSGDKDKVIRVWELDIKALMEKTPNINAINYIIANAVLVGDREIGKTSLGNRIACDRLHAMQGTHATCSWQISLPRDFLKSHGLDHVEADLILWDPSDQLDFCYIRPTLLNDVAVALLRFNPHDLEYEQKINFWSHLLDKQAPNAKKILVPCGPMQEDKTSCLLSAYNFYCCSTAYAGNAEGIDELKRAIFASIAWDRLPRRKMPLIFFSVKNYLDEAKSDGKIMLNTNEIFRLMVDSHEDGEIASNATEAAISIFEAQGSIYKLKTFDRETMVLLQTRLIDQYVESIILVAQESPNGAIAERDILNGKFPWIGFDEKPSKKEEQILLPAIIELLISNYLCLRKMGMLIFPGQIGRHFDPNDSKKNMLVEASYKFSGNISLIYARLVVRLSYTNYFSLEDQWKCTAEFFRDDDRLGFNVKEIGYNQGLIEINFDKNVNDIDKIVFIKFIRDHLNQYSTNSEEYSDLICPFCDHKFGDMDAIEYRIKLGYLNISCQYCGRSVIIPQSIEKRYYGDKSIMQKQQKMAKSIKNQIKKEIKAFNKDFRRYILAGRDK